mmetsp:Transcript_26252/g.55746  ORF Transcript_26252/g.55746 Transcript_26252/m.55746 type:complete len:182 (-) Transcript_26252:54-599(-)
MPIADIEGRIPGFDNRWNKTQMITIDKEDKLRWSAQDASLASAQASGTVRTRVKLPRAHSSIGPFPGCRRVAELSPRKSAAVCFIEQKLCRSESTPTMRERLYDGVSAEGLGKAKYLDLRKRVPLPTRYEQPATSNQVIGFNRPETEYRASPYCHHPVMEHGFFRTNGTVTYTNLPDNSRP